MVYLTPEEAIKIIKENRPPEEVSSCIRHDNHAFFHTEPEIDRSRLSYYPIFDEWVKKIIDKDKHEVFNHLNKSPIATVDLMESILGEFKKIFEAEDRYIGVICDNNDTEKEAMDFISEDYKFWQGEAFNAMRSSINSLVVVDIPLTQTTPNPEPYHYLLRPEYIIDYSYSKNKFDYVIIKSAKQENIYHSFDETSYKTFEKQNGTLSLVSETPHDLGYTPVSTFWSTPYNSKSKIQRRSPITNSLGELDFLLFWYISQKHVQLNNGFPITVMYEQKCSYKDEDGNFCNEGVIEWISDGVKNSKKCPSCSNRTSLLGAGKVIQAPARSHNDEPDLIDGIKFVSADVASLENLQSFIKTKENNLYNRIVGFVPEGNEAMNEKQLTSFYDSRYNSLMEVKRNFEVIHKWTIDTKLLLRYGKAKYRGATVNYGKKLFLFDLGQLNNEFKESKANGMPIYELENQIEQIIYTKYKNNPEVLNRSKILSDIEPYQGYTIDDLTKIKSLDANSLDPILLKIKINFCKYIERFENEHSKITSFMPEADYDKKAQLILDKLIEYANENKNLVDTKQLTNGQQIN